MPVKTKHQSSEEREGVAVKVVRLCTMRPGQERGRTINRQIIKEYIID